MTTKRVPSRAARLLMPLSALLLACLLLSGPLSAQDGQGAQRQSARESLDLNTIATLSVAVVYQSYGYIGTYADLYGTGVYDASRVNDMLRETIVYLTNSRDQLRLFETQAMGLSSGDKRYLADAADTMDMLIAEAQSLSAYTLNRNQEDLKRYDDNKNKAWARISKLLDAR